MRSDRSLNPATEMLLALVRNALWAEPLAVDIFSHATAPQWAQVVRLASRGGVTALAFEGIQQLPEALRPPRNLLLGWGVNAQRLAERYRRQEAAVGKLAAQLNERGVRTLVLKGLGTSLYYPRPHLRECGDIDVWLFGQWEEGNRFACENGWELDEHNEKHTTFVFENILVENHRTLLDEALYTMDRRLDRRLVTLLQQTPCRETVLEGCSVYFPPADFDALFLIRHAAMHFASGISLRHLADWACFLRAQGGRIDRDAFLRCLKEERLERFAGALTACACLWLGLPQTYAPMPIAPHRKDARRMFPVLLSEKKTCQSRQPLAVLGFKTRRFVSEQWRYRMVYGRFSFPYRVLLSVKSHWKRPDTIFSTTYPPKKK